MNDQTKREVSMDVRAQTAAGARACMEKSFNTIEIVRVEKTPDSTPWMPGKLFRVFYTLKGGQ